MLYDAGNPAQQMPDAQAENHAQQNPYVKVNVHL
jgi:hypothetical protein